jgi:hypothetical protein
MVLRYEDNCDDSTYAYRARPVNSAVQLLLLLHLLMVQCTGRLTENRNLDA